MNRYAKLQSDLDRWTSRALETKGLLRKLCVRRTVVIASRIGKLMKKPISEVVA